MNPRPSQPTDSLRESAAPNLGLIVYLLAAIQVFGQTSLVDLSFRIGSGPDGPVNALVLQADQRLLVGGEFTAISGCSNSFLARVNADGSVDGSFNPAGLTDGFVQRLVQQPDGKVLVGGSFGWLLGHAQPGLARLHEDGSWDSEFDARAVLGSGSGVDALTLQPDGRLLVAYSTEDHACRVVRLHTSGAPDPSFDCTNQFTGRVMALMPQTDGSVLVGGNGTALHGSTNYALFRLKPDGQVDATFDSQLELCSVFSLLRQTNGQILVGGSLRRRGVTNNSTLLRLNEDLTWDDTFHPDAFSAPAWISCLMLQTDGKIIAGGYFHEVGGYWRRHVVRLTSEGRVDGCFDPGLGLGDYPLDGARARALAVQPDGRVLVGGHFGGIDIALHQSNLGRLLPHNGCDLIRVYLNAGDGPFAAATFPPGGTNFLEFSEDLKVWIPVQTNNGPYIYHFEISPAATPRGFFRARQEQ